MKEQLYTIPVNDAFDKDGECPLCEMYEELLKAAVEFTLGPSYMEDDVRMETNRLGFCREHIALLYEKQNRLGLALMLKTHMDEVTENIERLQKEGSRGGEKKGLFGKKTAPSAVSAYVKQLEGSCYICDRINNTFDRYIDTIIKLYSTEGAFKEKVKACKGLCLKHYGMLRDRAEETISKGDLGEFNADIDKVFLEGFKRVRDDLDWYTRKFDYRFRDEPWKGAEDAPQRGMEKTTSRYYSKQ